MIRLTATALAAAVALGAGGAAAQDRGEIYYLIPTLLDEFQSTSQEAIEQVYGEMGYEVTSLDANNEAARQLNQCEDAVQTDPVAIILNAVDFDAAGPCIEAAHGADIPVLVYDRVIKSAGTELTSMAGTIQMGYIAAENIVRLLEERYGEPRGKVLQIMGDPGDAYTLDIRQGFDERIAEYENIEVDTRAAQRWEASNAGDIASDRLVADPDIDLIFVHAAHLAVPVVSVLEAEGNEPGDVMLVSSNGAPVGLDLIRQGWEQVEVEQPLYAQIWGMAMFTPMIVAGETPEEGTYDILGLDSELVMEDWGPTLYIPGAAITSDNVDEPRFWGNLQPPEDPVDPIEP
ncbi:MAG: sugar ABC transporter substrate-binding protein [Azospirillaceae bacterium]